MDLAAISMDMKTTQLQLQVGFAVQKLSMDSQKEDLEGIKKLMESSVAPHLGANIDFKG